MTLKGAVGGDFLDLVELGRERAFVAARIKRIDPPQPHKYDPTKTTQPVLCDLLVLSGKQKNHVQHEQTIMSSGVTPTILRGNKVGDIVLIRLEVRNSFGKDWPAAQGPTPEELERFAPLFADGAPDPFGGDGSTGGNAANPWD